MLLLLVLILILLVLAFHHRRLSHPLLNTLQVDALYQQALEIDPSSVEALGQYANLKQFLFGDFDAW